MARYIDADELYETVTKKYSDIVAGRYPYNIVAYDMARLVKEAPTADVVPRSEVEAYMNLYQSEMEKTVAREIFEEIEKIILDNTYPDFNREHKPVNIWKATTGYDAFYELKKKYTEEKKDEKN